MEFVLIDYSEFYYPEIAKRDIPLRRGGKFVQILNEDKQQWYLVLSPKELSKYHANIVERFCNLQGDIPGAYRHGGEYFEIFDPAWSVLGGGFWEIDDESRMIRFYGSSRAYGRFTSEGLAERIRSIDKRFAEYTVLVEC